jgi:hypothetical protein
MVEVLHREEFEKAAILRGISFFTGELLNWTLPSVLLALVADIERQG